MICPEFHDLPEKSLRKNVEASTRIAMAEDDLFYIGNTNPYLRPLRLVIAVWVGVCSWVFIPSYSGTLVSFFSLPFYAKTLDTLAGLNSAMKDDGYSLGT